MKNARTDLPSVAPIVADSIAMQQAAQAAAAAHAAGHVANGDAAAALESAFSDAFLALLSDDLPVDSQAADDLLLQLVWSALAATARSGHVTLAMCEAAIAVASGASSGGALDGGSGAAVAVDRGDGSAAHDVLVRYHAHRLQPAGTADAAGRDGAVHRTPYGDVLHVRSLGLSVDIHLSPLSTVARQALCSGTDIKVDGTPGAFTLCGSCFLLTSSGGLTRTTYYPTPRVAELCSMAGAVLDDDTARLALLHMGGYSRFPWLPVLASLTSLEACMPHMALDPGYGEVVRVWVRTSPSLWRRGDSPVCSTVAPDQFVARERWANCSGPCVGYAHLWLRHLPAWFIHRMACVSVQWSDAAEALMAWREDLDSRGAAFQRFGVPDECLLLAEAEELSAEEEAAAHREAAKRAALEARLEHLQEAREAAAARAAEFDQLSFSRTTSLTDGMLSCLEEGLEAGRDGAW